MCNLKIGQQVNLTGSVFCKACGQVAAHGGTTATFSGHEGGFDVFRLIEPLICPSCKAENKAVEQPCADPIVLDVAAQQPIAQLS